MESPAPRARIRQSTMFGYLACPRVLLISLLVALAVGCNDGQGDDQAPVGVFPRHDAPLGTDRGGQYLAGRLVLDSGCLRVEVPSNDASNPLPSRLLIIWPGAFTLSTEDGAVRIVDGLGRIAAHVGDHVRLRACECFEVPLWLSVMLVMGVRPLGVDRVESQLREAGLRESIGYIPGRIPSRSPGLPLLCLLTPSTPNAEGCAPRRQGA